MHQTSNGKSPKFVFTPTFIFYSPICSNNCVVVFFIKICFSFRGLIFFVRPLKYAYFQREYYPSCVTSCNECTWLTAFLWTWFFVLSSKLNPLSLLKLAKKCFFLVNIFVRHTFPMSKSSIKTKTVLTMTDMTESTELLAFKRQKDGYKVTVKISLCICVVLSWDELKVWQNLLDSVCEIYMVRLPVATVNWHKSLQFAKNLT